MAKILSAEVSAFSSNSYLVIEDKGAEAALIDPGGDPDIISAMIEKSGATVKYLLATHCHIDHIGAAAEMSRRLGLGLMAGKEDEILLGSHLNEAPGLFGLPPVEPPEITAYLDRELELRLGDTLLTFLPAPGHSPGSHIIRVDRDVIIVGDVLFRGSVGRTDLTGGDTATLAKSIEDQILSLDDETVVYSGHGPSTTVGRERRENLVLIQWGLST